MSLEWSETLLTGIPEIDKEHKEWIRRYNEFDRMVMEQRGAEMIKQALGFFSAYADRHFGHEEELAEGLSNPYVEKNRREHRKYRQQIKRIQDCIQSYGESMVSIMALKTDMEQWLIDHITGTDISLFKDRS